MNKAFTSCDQIGILKTNVDNSMAQGYSNNRIYGGYDTQDKVFALSYAETMNYLHKSPVWRCVATEYAIKQGAYIYKYTGEEFCEWWLRSPGGSPDSAIMITTGGALHACRVNTVNVSVRPAIWVNLETIFFNIRM